jgi:hypothetical protein
MAGLFSPDRRGSPRFRVGDPVIGTERAPSPYRHRRGRVFEVIESGTTSGCRVEFDDGTTGFLLHRWLERAELDGFKTFQFF